VALAVVLHPVAPPKRYFQKDRRIEEMLAVEAEGSHVVVAAAVVVAGQIVGRSYPSLQGVEARIEVLIVVRMGS
jgi:hypothetical protein